MQRHQRGFTLVEIAIVLVVIGLLLGGVLKGQELISSSRVRNLADQQAGIQSAFYGFQDRYRATPGDMDSTEANDAIQAEVATGGNANGMIDTSWDEVNAVWEHLSKSGFIKGNYNGSSVKSTSDDAPTNVFNGVLVLATDDNYAESDSVPRLILHMGRYVPAAIARELDVKVDDGQPNTGVLRIAGTDSPFVELAEASDDCTSGGDDDDPAIWDIERNHSDCIPTFLFQ